jgi:pyruvate dehydrogenase E1 component
LMNWAFDYLQREGVQDTLEPLCDDKGGSVYLRLTTRKIAQPDRELSSSMAADIISGGYWLRPPDANTRVVVAYSGTVAPQAQAACDWINQTTPECALLAVTSADRLHQGWQHAVEIRQSSDSQPRAHIENLLDELPAGVTIISVVDSHPATLSWLGSVIGHRVRALGVSTFGQSGNLHDLYQAYGIDCDAILRAYKRI